MESEKASWTGVPVAILDTETSGLDPSTSYVLDIAVVHARLGARDEIPVVAFQSLVKPPISIPPDSTRIHGIDDDLVRHAPSWASVQDCVLEALHGRLVVAFNAPFDVAMIHQEIVRNYGSDANSVQLHGRLEALRWPWLDLLVVRKACRPRQRAGRLVEIARELGVLLDAHGAAGDAFVTALVMDSLLEEAVRLGAFRSAQGVPARRRRQADDPDPGPHRLETVSDLLSWQREAALWQEAEYASYCARRGDKLPPRFPWHALLNVPTLTWDVEPPPEGRCVACGTPVLRVVTRSGRLVVVDAAPTLFRRCVDEGAFEAWASGDAVRGLPDPSGETSVRIAHGCVSAGIQWDVSDPCLAEDPDLVFEVPGAEALGAEEHEPVEGTDVVIEI